MLETKARLSLRDLVWLKTGREGDGSGKIVLRGRTVWEMPGRGGGNRYGVAFFDGQGQSYERLQQHGEVTHFKDVAEALGLGFVDLTPSMVERRVLGYITRELASSLNCMPIKLRGERLMVAMAEPGDPRAVEKLQLFSRCKILPVVATPSAIKNTLIQCWGSRYVPSLADRAEEPLPRKSHQVKKPRIIAIVSAIPGFTGTNLAMNLAAVWNREEKRALLVDPHSESSVLSDGVWGRAGKHYELMIVTLPTDENASNLDRAIGADEALLVVSPFHWQKGCYYIEVLFNRFTGVQRASGGDLLDESAGQRVLELSVVCAELPDIRQGFKVFNRMETRIHHELDMKEPGFDIRLHYLGGILDDGRNTRKAEKTGVPLTTLKPLSPASQCMTHIAHSLLKPTQARDPRMTVTRPLLPKIFG